MSMRVLTKLAVLSLAILLVTDSLGMAQQRRRGFSGRRFGGINKSTLLRAEQVQNELKLSETQIAEFKELSTEARSQQRELFAGLGDLSREERREKFRELAPQRQKLTAETDKKLDALLNADQLTRLNEILLQVQGARALAADSATKRFKITASQRQKIREALASAGSRRREQFRDFRDLSREERREKTDQLNKETDASILDVLTAEQKSEFEKAQGAKFELDRRALFQRRRRNN